LVVQVVDQTYNKRKPKPVRVMRLVTNLKNPLKIGPTLTGRAVPKIKSKKTSDVSNVEDVNDLSDEWYLTKEGILEMASRYNKSNYIPAKRTEITKEQLISGLKEIWPTVFKEYEMNDKALDIIVAHINLETGNTKSMFNYNFGNVKATPEWSQNHKWTSYACGETLKGKTYKFTAKHPMSFFRAFDNLEEGMGYYLQTLGGRYKGALELAIKGDVTGFSEKLHEKSFRRE
jgi:flagellum-specific peptidoglycan hydrolase FlgJ